MNEEHVLLVAVVEVDQLDSQALAERAPAAL